MQANGISGFRRLTDRGFSHSEPLRCITTRNPNSAIAMGAQIQIYRGTLAIGLSCDWIELQLD
jgi:hypothetical protein